MNKPQQHTGPILPWAPSFYPGESFCSWILRLTGACQYTFHQISQLTTIKPKKKDWDLGLSTEQKHKFLQSVGLGCDDLPKERIDEDFLRSHAFRLIPRQAKNLPSYAWCDQCFLEDKDPYLRWRWRYKNYTYCLKHKTKLQERCPTCESLYVVATALTCVRRVSDAILDLSYCAACGCSLARSPQYQQAPSDPFFERYAQKIKTMDISAVEHFADWLVVSRIRSLTSQHSFRLFPENPAKLFKAREAGSMWSRNLSRPSRIKLTRAMQIIRRERNDYRKKQSVISPLD
jgi:hypothetical protein